MGTEQVAELPILNNNRSANGSCGSTCACSEDDPEFLDRLRQLQNDLALLTTVFPATGTRTQPTFASTAKSAVYRFSMKQPILLVDEITHREIDGKHLWVGVKEAAVTVLTPGASEIAEQLRNGLTPEMIMQGAGDHQAARAESWNRVSKVIGQLARAGFLKGIRGYIEDRPSTPDQFARFHLTKACQLECIHCYADSSPTVSRSGELETERWQALASAFVANGGKSVLFTGGEALLHQGCLAIMRTVRESGADTTLFTNGMLVPKYAKEIHELATSVQVSLDGPDAASNDAIRGTNTYRHIRRAIDILVAQGTPTRIGMSVMLSNWEAWKTHFLEFADQYKGTSVEFRLSFGLTHYGRAKELAPIAVEDVQPLAFAFMESVNGSTGPKITRTTRGCGYCEQLVVGPDGRVYPCHLLDAPVCHIDEFEVPQLINVLRRLGGMYDVDQVDGCRSCDIRYLCGGTCRVINRQQTGSRLTTTCGPREKERKVHNLLRTYSN